MKIAILDDYQNVALSFADWDSLDAEIEVFTEPFADADEVVERLAGFDVLVAMRERTRFPAELLARLTALKLLVSTGARNAAIDVNAARKLGIVVSTTGYIGYPTAELTWALILAAARNLPAEVGSMRDGGWQVGVGTGLNGKTLGLLGLGRLGAQVARIGQAFGMETVAWSQNLTPEKAAEHGVTAVSKEDLFALADVLSIHLVLGDRSRGLVGAAELAAMKPTAILVNTSRGPIVDEDALLDALRRKKIACAALDVYDTEPLPADHPLRALGNTVLTPHVGYVTREVYEIFYRDAVEDIAAFQSGNPIRVMD
ncbi:D-2-hydroxyacid dehydrogenase family protein [Streptosporangium lutulentum]|uniref:Phosphoglycerate dehydrogenase-like enzyme n=1 Tax=Streptosporangium lutulentum TaxID=1461250 RepID=A0ABT9Q7D8_9ACTN|nr:D-2-hydroxyacid dehydrogenase family protein [Streptosporangium lutulentum]MDP9842572.1 phosphoglycerate dehydrogenase-like enzyme [Streptosporangium lutulentum]